MLTKIFSFNKFIKTCQLQLSFIWRNMMVHIDDSIFFSNWSECLGGGYKWYKWYKVEVGFIGCCHARVSGRSVGELTRRVTPRPIIPRRHLVQKCNHAECLQFRTDISPCTATQRSNFKPYWHSACRIFPPFKKLFLQKLNFFKSTFFKKNIIFCIKNSRTLVLFMT